VDDELVPVCIPKLAAELGDHPSPAALAPFTLIHDVYRHDWQLWLEAAGVATAVDASRGPIFMHGNGAYDAMKAGLGIALMRRSFVEGELKEGTVAAPFPLGVASRLAFHLVYPGASLERPAAAAFRRWLLSESKA